ncbi:hypothetical protein HJFPF1_01544 [Paramyrothecium foliicola]|nr:hypothetical protein HJFPF1_01544 [Paramyrothecium foliicola]
MLLMYYRILDDKTEENTPSSCVKITKVLIIHRERCASDTFTVVVNSRFRCAEKLFDETEKLFDETEKLFDETEKLFDETEKLFDETEKLFDETENLSRRSSDMGRVSSFKS